MCKPISSTVPPEEDLSDLEDQKGFVSLGFSCGSMNPAVDGDWDDLPNQ